MDGTDLVGSLLPVLEAADPRDVMATLAETLREASGATAVELFLVDYDLELLRALGGAAEVVDVEQGDLGRAFVEQRTIVVPADAGEVAAYLPVSTRGERVGVLVVTLPAAPDQPLVNELERVALLMALMLPRLALYSDEVERTRRVIPLTLPAEIQWGELPLRAYSCDRFEIAGQLCPAYEVGGDIFDYVLEGDHLHVMALDAMGHGLQASLLGSLAINTLRNNRRAGLSLVDRVRGADRVLYGQHGGDKFVCGAFLCLNTVTGELTIVNAGHPVGLLVRDGTATPLEVPAQLPLGLFEQTIYEQHPMQLRPGDRLVIVSDGVLEAAPPGGEEYGEERLATAVLALPGVGADETARRVIRQLRDYEGVELRDDVTVIVLQWHGPRPRGAHARL